MIVSLILRLSILYLLFVFVFAIQKPLFMLFHSDIYANATFTDFIEVIYNGLPLDNSMAGYLTIIPGFLLIASQWVKKICVIQNISKVYFTIIAIIISFALCLDLVLYEYWGFRLDMTPFFYFTTSPEAAMASATYLQIIIGLISVTVIAISISWLLNKSFTSKLKYDFNYNTKTRIKNTGILVLLIGALFIPIRGGFTVATMNLSAVYYSQNQELNHAAINPLFSFMYSATHQNNFSSQFRYFDNDKATDIFKEITSSSYSSLPDSITCILKNKRPDIYLIILESFSSHLLKSLNGREPIATHIDSLATTGILFSNFYANGIRTDRGIPAILSGYPALPNTSIMKYVDKTDNLPSIARSLKQNGWETTYYYGGDANFTNMHAYLVSSGFRHIISDKDFPIGERLSKWGVHDHLVFNRCLNDISSCESSAPQFRVIQTSSSHEPFEVPFKKLDNNRANAFAYTDSCVGDFTNHLKDIGKWENSLIILVPDHYGAYPQKLHSKIDRHRIPLIFTGGAITNAMRIATTGSQIDIAATILSQLDISHKEFIFSKNLFKEHIPHYAFITSPSMFGMVENDNYIIYDFDSDNIIETNGNNSQHLLKNSKAFVQKLYDDIDNR